MYGLQPTAATAKAVSHHSISSNALKRLRVRLARSSDGLGVLEKTRWAIHDAAKFQNLIGHLRDLIDGLMRGAPRPQDTHDKKVKDDIASMADDISRLRLFSAACEDKYPTWSKTARSAIDASEIVTIDGYLANDRLERYQAENDENAPGDVGPTLVLPTYFGDDKGIFREPRLFVHTNLDSLSLYQATNFLRIDRAMSQRRHLLALRSNEPWTDVLRA